MTPIYSDQAMNLIESIYMYNYDVDWNGYLRPVINVTTDNGFASGDGTSENPYIIQAE